MLYDILKNRASVNILKQLSEKELKKSYSSSISDFRYDKKQLDEAIAILSTEGLIYKEGSLISISEKGKRFIEIFDKLVELFKAEKTRPEKNIEVTYDLTDFEKKVLFTLFKIHHETGRDVSLSNLTEELFPYEKSEKKKIRVSKELTKLEQLNLAKKIKRERNVFAQITDSGIKVVKRQIITEVKKVL